MHRNHQVPDEEAAVGDHWREVAEIADEMADEAEAAEEGARRYFEMLARAAREVGKDVPPCPRLWQSTDTNVQHVRVGEPNLFEQLDWELSQSNRPHHPSLSDEDHLNLVDRR